MGERDLSAEVRVAEALLGTLKSMDPEDPLAEAQRRVICDTAVAYALVAFARRFEEVFNP